MKLWKMAARNIGRNRRRSILSGSAIAIAAMVFVIMFSVVEGLKIDLTDNLTKYFTGQVRIRNSQYDENEELNPLFYNISDFSNLLEKIEALPEIDRTSPRIQVPGVIFKNDTNYTTLCMGVDFTRENDFMDIDSILISGALPDEQEKQALAGSGLAEQLDLEPGDKITLMSKTMNRGTNAYTFTVTGIIQTPVHGLNTKLILAPLEQVQKFVKMPGGITEILIISSKDSSPENTAGILSSFFSSSNRPELTAVPWNEIEGSYSIVEIANSVYSIIAVIFFILGSTVIVNTTMMVVYERIREIGTISALGMYGGEIVRLFFLEAFFIALLGSLAGILLGIGITIPLSHFGIDFSRAMEGFTLEVSPVFYPALDLRSPLTTFFYAIGVSSIASLFPSWRSARIQPVEALRTV